MFALEPLVTERLKAHLQTTLPDVKADVKGWSEEGDRKTVSGRVAVLVRLAGTPPGAVSKVAAAIGTAWAIELRAKRGTVSAAQLDQVFGEVLAALHDWVPAKVDGRAWSNLAYQSTELADYIEDGVFGLAMIFQSAAIYPGKR